MKTIDIITQSPKAVQDNKKPENWKFAASREFPDTAAELADVYGDEAVVELFTAQFKIAFQAVVRRLAEAGKTDEEIEAIMRDWKPGEKVTIGDADPLARAMNKFASMSREEQAAYIASLQEKAAQAQS